MESPTKVIKKSVILVPYDFGPKSVAALNEAITITKYVKGKIFLLSVVRKSDFFSQLFRSEKDNRRILREVRAKLKEIAKEKREEHNIVVSIIVEQGNPNDVILEQAEILKAQYIVMGKMGESSMIDFSIFETSTLPIIARSPCPVMTVSDKNLQEGFKNIVLPIDLTKQTFEKIIKAISWAKYYKSNIHLVGILTGGIPIPKSRLASKLEKAKFIIEREGVPCSAELYEKDSNTPIHRVILQHAKKVNGDLLMIMTHQELGVIDNYIGAVAQKILRESDIPVISFSNQAIEHNDYFVSSFLPFELLNNKGIEHLKG